MAQFRQTAGRAVSFIGWLWVGALLCVEAVGCAAIYQQDGFWAMWQAYDESVSPFNAKAGVRILLYLPGFALAAWGRKIRHLSG